MNLAFVMRVVRERRNLRTHERWPRARLDEQRALELASLRQFALDRSPFYLRFHAGLQSRPLADLPVLTKAELMESFEDLVTDRDVRLAKVAQTALGKTPLIMAMRRASNGSA